MSDHGLDGEHSRFDDNVNNLSDMIEKYVGGTLYPTVGRDLLHSIGKHRGGFDKVLAFVKEKSGSEEWRGESQGRMAAVLRLLVIEIQDNGRR